MSVLAEFNNAHISRRGNGKRTLDDIILDNLITEIGGLATYFVYLDTEMAEYFLAHNDGNRPITLRHVKTLARSITNGEWELNGETIVVSDTGRLIQGQHRCKAVLETGIPIQTLLVVGVPDAAFPTYDCGRKRTTADVFSISGEKNATVEAGAARLLFEFERYGVPYANNRDAASSLELLNLIHTNPDMRESATFSKRSEWARKYLTPSLACFCHYVFSRRNRKAAQEFFEALESGVGFTKGSPILVLRERLMKDANSKSNLTNKYKCALAFKAFKLHLKGATVKYLKIATEGDKAETDIFRL